MKRITLAVLLVLALLPLSRAHGAEPVLTLATVDNIPPFVYVENDRLVGLSIDIIGELARRGQFQVRYEVSPWARVLLRLERGLVDGGFSAYWTGEREAYCLYTGIVHYDELRVATRRDRTFTYTGVDSLRGKTVGKGRQVFVGPEFESAVEDGLIELSETDDMKMVNIKMLHEGRLDAVIGSPVAMLHYASVLGYDDIVLAPGAVRERIPAYLVLSRWSGLKDKSGWQRRLTDLLSEMHADGTIGGFYADHVLSRGGSHAGMRPGRCVFAYREIVLTRYTYII